MKTISWNTFISFATHSENVVEVVFYFYPRRYSFSEKGIRLGTDKQKIEFFAGPYVDGVFLKEFNESIPFDDEGFLNLNLQIFDSYESDEEETIQGNDGMEYTRPVIKYLDTFVLEPIKVRILELIKNFYSRIIC